MQDATQNIRHMNKRENVTYSQEKSQSMRINVKIIKMLNLEDKGLKVAIKTMFICINRLKISAKNLGGEGNSRTKKHQK